MLNYRLNLLYDYVDYFVLVEATHTHAGKEKELIFEKNKNRFENFLDKIIHIVVDDFPCKWPNINYDNGEQWKNEKYQRNCISRGFSQLDLVDDDIIIIADVDEIPDPEILMKVKSGKCEIDVRILEMDFYYYNLNSKLQRTWPLAKIISYQKFKELGKTCDDLRFHDCDPIQRAGWHLSYFGDGQFIKNKIEQFAHQEYNNPHFTTIQNIENRIKNNSDVYDRHDNPIKMVSIKDNFYLPIDYDKYLQNFIVEIE
jgi:beta-1,4-mannosyl-glycoprotein beta-1,4-N-acetylglucosaminyltransferase